MSRWVVYVALGGLLAACGGTFSGSGDGDGGSTGSGGSGSQAGSGSSQAGSSSTGKICKVGGKTYQEGDSFPAEDGCNTCSCNDGAVGCTLIDCGPGHCESLSADYAAAMDQARSCDPSIPMLCAQVITEGLACGCEIYVNPANWEAIAAVQAARAAYGEARCAGDVVCGACAPPSGGYCSREGRCETTHDTAGGSACKVDGIVYPNGTGGIPDPSSCNSCECVDGQLACTEIGCDDPTPCPPDSVNGTQCAQCGPADGCEVVEYSCLPVCTDTCESGTCIDGVCRLFCG